MSVDKAEVRRTNLKIVAIVTVFVVTMFVFFAMLGQANNRAIEFCDFDRDNGPAWMQEAQIGARFTWPPGFECVFSGRDPETGQIRILGTRDVGLWP